MDATFRTHRERLRDLLRTLSYEERPVVLASGRPSTFYIDCRQAVLTAEGHFLVGWLLHHLLVTQAPAAEAVGGVVLGAAPLASATSLISYLGGRALPAFYIRKEPKGHGTGQWLEGSRALRPGARVALVEDVITTGGSTLAAIARVREAGLAIERVFALVDRGEGGRAAVEAEAPLEALYRPEDFR